MHYISSNVKKMMEMNGLSISELSRQTGVSKATISRWFSEEKVPRIDMIEKIASRYNLPMDYFLDESFTEYWKFRDGEWSEKGDPDNEPTFETSAGYGRINDNYEKSDEYSTVRINGDSMLPSLRDGDLVRVHHITDDISAKDFTVVKINGNESIIKHVEITKDGLWVRSENECYDDVFYTMQECLTIPVTIIGKAESIIERKL